MAAGLFWLIAVVVLGVLAVSAMIAISRSSQPDRLRSPERKELEAYRNLNNELLDFTIEQARTGDQTADVVLDMLNQTRRSLNKKELGR